MSMTHRERLAAIYAGRTPDRAGFWLGDPHEQLVPQLYEAWGVKDDEGLRRAVRDDCRWLTPPEGSFCGSHDSKPIFATRHGMPVKKGHGEPGCFADCTSVAEVDRHPWPEAAWVDLARYRDQMRGREDVWRMGGVWGCFFHNAMDYFGIEEYFMKMYSHPEVVHAVTRHIVDFYLAVNERIFRECPEVIDVAFFGNDFGTQQRLFVNLAKFKEFVLPYFRELIDQAKRHGKPVQLHSCGAICQAIPWLIDAGIDGLHPLQAKAVGMEATTLAAKFGRSIVFVGGIDTQDLLWRGTPQQIKDEVNRLREVFGDRWVISPSHEKIMPEVPVANVIALCEAATGGVPDPASAMAAG